MVLRFFVTAVTSSFWCSSSSARFTRLSFTTVLTSAMDIDSSVSGSSFFTTSTVSTFVVRRSEKVRRSAVKSTECAQPASLPHSPLNLFATAS